MHNLFIAFDVNYKKFFNISTFEINNLNFDFQEITLFVTFLLYENRLNRVYVKLFRIFI